MIPALQFNPEPYHPNDEGNLLLRFREQGYVVAGGVFQRDSVDAYLEQIKSLVKPNNQWHTPYVLPMDEALTVWPAKAPRLMSLLAGTFSWGRTRLAPVLFNPGWLIRPSNPEEKIVHGWHKDGDHEGLGNLGADGYTYPSVVHVNMYFADTTEAHGPTYVIPGSHRDRNLSPFRGDEKLEKPLVCNKGDVVLWDQRVWHRGSARTVEGLRIVAIFGFFGCPVAGRHPPVPGQIKALQSAANDQEKVVFGGPFLL